MAHVSHRFSGPFAGALPYVRALTARGGRITFALVPDGDGESTALARYGERLVGELTPEGSVDIVTTGSGPARTLVHLAESLDVDLVVVASHGRSPCCARCVDRFSSFLRRPKPSTRRW